MEEKLKREALNEGHPRSPDGEVEKSKGPTAGNAEQEPRNPWCAQSLVP